MAASSKGNGLLLYHYYHSFYSQKVIMALHEKKLGFTTQHVDLDKQENFQEVFLKVNPQADVPVLQDGIKVIPESQRILDYLEDNFSNGGTPRLIPLDQGPTVRQTVLNFRYMLDSHQMDVLAMGCLLYPDVAGEPSAPFTSPVVANRLKDDARGLPQHLREVARRSPEFRSPLLHRSREEESRLEAISSKQQFKQRLDKLAATLSTLEEYLTSRREGDSDWWLCCRQFTVADVSLSLVLHWVSCLGLSHWLRDRPRLAGYLRRVRQRPSFQKATCAPALEPAFGLQWWWRCRWLRPSQPSSSGGCPCTRILVGATTLLLLGLVLYVRRWRK